jgi:ABC-type glycerol-3-phosphate transport system substrate-binding protein
MSSQTRLLGRFALLAATALGLAACGGGAGATGQVKLAVADAPADGAQAVVVKFTGVELTAIPTSR